MLQLRNIVKTYITGDLRQDALQGVSINFRENEFVSILGQSGSGKTTLLNIIGGLDRYTSGDLIINGVSTTQYKDGDWDYYRNSSIGFVFQSYNLIPHQSVLANVEMALTLAGVSKKERRMRAKEVLKKVGLADHIHKRPNQMSGGQMQRVAIARALINNPDILLADEPTGALDSETSVQIMELLKEIARDKLVIMVTHNPELAQAYSTRIVKLRDGKIIDDSDPYPEEEVIASASKRKRISMSFFTALALSFNNLRTKKGRTLLTAFAGSIGIIGIALILSLSTGMQAYIDQVQKDTMTSYPITITDQAVDVSSIMGLHAEMMGQILQEQAPFDTSKVHVDYTNLETAEKLTTSLVENNLTDFKKYLDDPNSEIQQYLGENGVIYTYDVSFSVYTRDADGNLIDTDMDLDSSSGNMMYQNPMASVIMGRRGSAANFSQLLPGKETPVSEVTTDSYEMIYGNWPQNYNELVLVVDDRNGVSAERMCRLGLITKSQYDEAAEAIENGEEATAIGFDFTQICNHTFYLVPACDHYVENDDGTFRYLENNALNEQLLLDNAVEMKITGIIRPIEDAENATITTALAYTSALTDHIITHSNESPVILAQEASPETNILSGMRFEAPGEEEKIADAKAYLHGLTVSEKAQFYQLMMYYASTEGAASQAPTGMPMDESSMAAMLDGWLDTDPDKTILLSVYEQYIAGATYEDNMSAFGKVSYDAPSSISIYTDTFENKDRIAECITAYNEAVQEDDRITYTDFVALLTSSLTTVINGISWLLIGFVAISLVVSCIMIGIITHISVMERTKEIGILRALGASKSNISQVFNAETFIIGCCAGLLGIGISLLLLIPINGLIGHLTSIENLNAQLPPMASVILIVLSIIITILGGLIPAKKAAKKDPVIALRTE